MLEALVTTKNIQILQSQNDELDRGAGYDKHVYRRSSDALSGRFGVDAQHLSNTETTIIVLLAKITEKEFVTHQETDIPCS